MTWPYRPKPLPDELLSSWLRRIGFVYAPKLHSFCDAVWPGTQIWNRDIDRLCPEDVFSGLVDGTGVSREAARQTLLSRYEDTVIEGDVARSNAAWILTIGVWHRQRRGFGQQFCPRCLAEDKLPYYRTYWRLAWVTSCSFHGCRLADRCSRCGTPCVPHRSREPRCHECGKDRRTQKFEHADRDARRFQNHLWRVLTNGYFPPFGLQSTHPLSAFGTVHQIAQTIVSGVRSADLRCAIRRQHRRAGGRSWDDMLGFDQGKQLEWLGVEAREEAMALSALVMRSWPVMFVGFYQEANVWRSWAVRDRELQATPYELASVVDHYLSKTVG